MEFTTEPLDIRRTQQRPCGMVSKPYTRTDKCRNLATALVTDESWHTYQNYRLRFNKYHDIKALPVLLQIGICDEHINMIKQLPDNPKAPINESTWKV